MATSAVGPPIGGLPAGAAGWRWAFLINIPVTVIALAMAVRWLPRDPVLERGHSGFRQVADRIDLPGVLGFAVSMTGLVGRLPDGPAACRMVRARRVRADRRADRRVGTAEERAVLRPVRHGPVDGVRTRDVHRDGGTSAAADGGCLRTALAAACQPQPGARTADRLGGDHADRLRRHHAAHLAQSGDRNPWRSTGPSHCARALRTSSGSGSSAAHAA
ncbi:MFS transporter [Streptomyces sp. NPDC056309]|uniref:MFS transporter n=1 Tax=unclassified Streptomyces TaxID=2593676 RepID=UPI0035DBCF9C